MGPSSWVLICYYGVWGVKNLDTLAHRPARDLAHAEQMLKNLKKV